MRDLTQASTGTTSSSASFEIQDPTLNPQSRYLDLSQMQTLIRSVNQVLGLTSGVKVTSAQVSGVTSSSAINTGLSSLTAVVVNLVGLASSGTYLTTWSALASTGWFQAFVWAITSSGSATPTASTVSANLSWIATGT